MSRRNIWKGLGLAAVATLALGFFCGSGRAMALNAETIKSIKSKAALEGVYQCFKGGAYSDDWLASSGGLGFLDEGLANDAVKLPYGLTDASNNKANCREIMKGFSVQDARDDDDLSKGLIPANIQNAVDSGKIVEFFAGNGNGMGYIASEAGNVDAGQDAQQMFISIDPERTEETSCLNNEGFRDRVELKSGDEYIGNKLIFPKITKNNDGSWFFGDTYSVSDGINVPDPGSNDIKQYSICGITFTIMDSGDKNNVYYEMQINGNSYYIQPQGGDYDDYNGKEYTLTREYITPYNPYTGTGGEEKQVMVGLRASVENSKVDTSDIGIFDDWRLQWPAAGVSLMRPVKWLNENNNIGYNVPNLDDFNYMRIGLSENETYDLYKYYVKEVYRVPVICDGEEDYELYTDSDSKIINWKEGTTCRAFTSYQQANMNPDDVYGVDVNLSNVMWPAHFTKKINSFDEVLAVLGKIDLGRVDASEGGTIGALSGAQGPGSVPGSQDEDKCYGGAGLLGWIVCPVMSGLADLGASAYKWIEENFLQVRASIFSEDENGVRDAWETIRNVANVGFIILLLIVIISQVTGYGIDNYGIKRILPKLIVGAIIMNLSYIICELMIDASNIAGSGLKDMLDGMGSGLDSKLLASNESYKASGGQYAAVFGAGIIATAISMILSSGTVGAVLMLFIALLSVVISILVLFVVLIIRQAGVVICVVIAPIAIACYLLPNTEKYFKKWLDLMKGLLIVYPLCGLIIGAGDFLGKIFGNLAVESAGNLQMGFALSAMVVTAIPYLFIPTLLKSSLAAMGNLGAKISGLGARLRGGASKKIKDSDAMKASRQRAADSRAMRKAGYSERRGGLTARGKLKARFAKTKIGSAIGYTRMQSARIQAAEKISDANKEARASLSSETAAADIAEYMAKNPGKGTNDYFQEQINNAGGDVRKLDAAILTAQKRGLKNKDIAAMIRKAQNNGKLKFKDEQSKANWMNNMLKNHGDIVSTDYDMQEWMRDGGKEPLGDYGEYVAKHRNISDVDISDLSKMSGDSLAGAIKAGLVSAPVAQQWLAANPNQSPDKKVMMGAVASGVVDANSLRNISANDFKKEAQSLLDGGKTKATTSVISDGAIRNGSGKDIHDLVDSWTTTAQVRAYVSQDSSTLKPGQAQKEPVRVVAEGQVIDVRQPAIDVSALGIDTLLDIVTSPNSSVDDATRTAAENEYYKRVAISSMQHPQNPPQNNPPQTPPQSS